MSAKFSARREDFNLIPKNMKALKEFLSGVPDTASYKIEARDGSVFFSTYWIDVNEVVDPEPVVVDVYTIEMPHICVYGKLAHEIVTDIKAHDGIPFVLNATDTIHLTK